MTWATTLIQFPQGLVAIAISVAILPTLSRQAARSGSVHDFQVTLGQGLRLATVLIIPAAVGLYILANPLVALIFEHGKFTAPDTAITALALRLYVLGLPFAAIDLLLVFAFYARQNTLTPAVIGLISLGAYMVIAIGLLRWYALFALMVADSVKFLIHTTIAAWLLRRSMGGFGNQGLGRTIARTSLAAAGMGVATWGAAMLLERVAPAGGTMAHLIVVTGAGGVGVITFSVLASVLHVDEWRWIGSLIWRSLGR